MQSYMAFAQHELPLMLRWMGAFGAWSLKRELGYGNACSPEIASSKVIPRQKHGFFFLELSCPHALVPFTWSITGYPNQRIIHNDVASYCVFNVCPGHIWINFQSLWPLQFEMLSKQDRSSLRRVWWRCPSPKRDASGCRGLNDKIYQQKHLKCSVIICPTSLRV